MGELKSMKKTNAKERYLPGIVLLFFLVGLCCLIAACFSPWKGDMGTFSVSIGGGGGNGRGSLPWDESINTDKLEHVIKLSGGPAPDQTRSITGSGTATFTVQPGDWNVSVEDYYTIPANSDEPGQKSFVAYGAKTVTIQPGPNDTASVEMWQVINSWGLLKTTIDVNEIGSYTYVLSSYGANSDWTAYLPFGGSINISSSITLIAANNIDISRDPNNLDYPFTFFSINNGGSLTLQTTGGSTLIMDGGGSTSGAPSLITVNGAFEMNDGVKLINNTGDPNTWGAGVAVNEGGAFTMNGGTISGNTTQFSGGGVSVSSGGIFTMNGGTISGNTAQTTGGGVYVGQGGKFTKSGGVIYGDDVAANANISGQKKGNAVYVAVDDNNGSGPIYRTEKIRNTTAGPSVNLDSEVDTWPQ